MDEPSVKEWLEQGLREEVEVDRNGQGKEKRERGVGEGGEGGRGGGQEEQYGRR